MLLAVVCPTPRVLTLNAPSKTAADDRHSKLFFFFFFFVFFFVLFCFFFFVFFGCFFLFFFQRKHGFTFHVTCLPNRQFA